MTIADITNYLESFAPLNLQEPYDNAGLIVGSSQREISKVLICLDATEEVVAEAIVKGCELIIAHHPIIFSGLKKITGASYIERVIINAIKSDIAIYAAHTNLDNIKHGVNGKIAEKLKVKNCKILAPKVDLNTGSGMIGDLDHALSEKDFLNFLKEQMNCEVIRHTKFLKKNIQKVAICGGSGSFLLKNAILQRADAFVSADFKYHQFFDADNKILIADIGHYESEQHTMQLFYDLLTKKFPNFAFILTEKNTNPINYL